MTRESVDKPEPLEDQYLSENRGDLSNHIHQDRSEDYNSSFNSAWVRMQNNVRLPESFQSNAAFSFFGSRSEIPVAGMIKPEPAVPAVKERLPENGAGTTEPQPAMPAAKKPSAERAAGMSKPEAAVPAAKEHLPEHAAGLNKPESAMPTAERQPAVSGRALSNDQNILRFALPDLALPPRPILRAPVQRVPFKTAPWLTPPSDKESLPPHSNKLLGPK